VSVTLGETWGTCKWEWAGNEQVCRGRTSTCDGKGCDIMDTLRLVTQLTRL